MIPGSSVDSLHATDPACALASAPASHLPNQTSTYGVLGTYPDPGKEAVRNERLQHPDRRSSGAVRARSQQREPISLPSAPAPGPQS